MNWMFFRKKISSFQFIIFGFSGVILIGALLLMLPVSARHGNMTSFEDALFTATSAVCVTGLVVKDTATYWSLFGQTVILLLIQIGGLGVVSVAAFIAMISGRKITLLQRSMLQDTMSAHQIGGIVKMTGFIYKVAFAVEGTGAMLMMPVFCKRYGASGIWMAVFHSVSAFCNAGFDVMGSRTGPFSSLTSFSSDPWIVFMICGLIIFGGIGFVTWEDMWKNRWHLKRYRMQSKVILVTTAVLIIIPTFLFYYNDFSGQPESGRFALSLFQAVTPRTAGFNTADLTAMTAGGKTLLIALMLIGGSPGSTAGGMKTTSIAVLFANSLAVFRGRKQAKLFGRRIEDSVIKNAATLMMMYIGLTLAGGLIINLTEKIPVNQCLFETASAIGTVGLTLGITPDLGTLSHVILIGLMFFGRVGGLTIMFAAVLRRNAEVSQYPVEKIAVG